MANIYRERRRTMKLYTPFIAILAILSFVLLSSSTSSLFKNTNSSTLITDTEANGGNQANGCSISFGEYRGHKYKTAGTIGEGKCLVQSRWMQVMQHKVQLDDKTQIDDWLFIDYHDRINVLVEDPKHSNSNNHNHNRNHNNRETQFLIFRQTKYALEGRQSYAIVGGIIEPGEKAVDAAQREVHEELGLLCDTTFLGRFRTDVNRGMGWVNSFIAHNCETQNIDARKHKKQKQIIGSKDEVGAPDTERQDVISMSLSDVKKNVKLGEFLEVQWSNTVALAMMDERYQ